jgi:16S rRNA (cytosine967-C5)-methyltransferase
VQDEGSQLIAELVDPAPGSTVIDACAGEGGKTLAIGALLAGRGRIIACDVSAKKLDVLKRRAQRAGVVNVQTVLIEREGPLAMPDADRVLVDAPCSGFGTLRRNPDLKWRQTENAIAELTAKQLRILTAAAALVKTGGRVVYATCSFVRAENQDVVNAFLAAHPQFTLVPANQVLAHCQIPLDTGEFLQLYPHIHGCDGFFAAVLERKA